MIAAQLLALFSVVLLQGITEGVRFGAEVTSASKYPYVVKLQSHYKHKWRTGIIINKDTVLTVASGLFPEELKNPEYVGIIAGTVNSYIKPVKPIEIRAKEIVVHHQYFNNKTKPQYNLRYDLALIKLNESLAIQNNPNISAAILDTDTEADYIGSSGIVVGWGTNFAIGYLNKVLRESYQNVTDHELCVRSPTSPDVFDPAFHFAAWHKHPDSRDPSVEDVGAPLVQKRGSENVVIGLVRLTHYDLITPATYLKVAPHQKWIKQHSSV